MNLRLSLAFVLLLPNLLFGQVKISDKDIKIVSASKESWSPGNVQDNSKPGGGMIFQIRADIKKNGEFVFDSLVSASGSLPVEVIKNTTRNYKGPLKKGEHITVIAYQHSDKFQKNSPAISKLVAKQKNGAFFISYRVQGKKCLVRVNEFQRKTSSEQNQ